MDPSSDMEKAMEKLWSRFNQADERFTTSVAFVELIEKNMNKVSEEPYSQMKLVSDELKFRVSYLNMLVVVYVSFYCIRYSHELMFRNCESKRIALRHLLL